LVLRDYVCGLKWLRSSAIINNITPSLLWLRCYIWKQQQVLKFVQPISLCCGVTTGCRIAYARTHGVSIAEFASLPKSAKVKAT
jgi:hypothetical protein